MKDKSVLFFLVVALAFAMPTIAAFIYYPWTTIAVIAGSLIVIAVFLRGAK